MWCCWLIFNGSHADTESWLRKSSHNQCAHLADVWVGVRKQNSFLQTPNHPILPESHLCVDYTFTVCKKTSCDADLYAEKMSFALILTFFFFALAAKLEPRQWRARQWRKIIECTSHACSIFAHHISLCASSCAPTSACEGIIKNMGQMTDNISFLPVKYPLPLPDTSFFSSWPFFPPACLYFSRPVQFYGRILFPGTQNHPFCSSKPLFLLAKQTAFGQMAKADTAINLDF